MKTVLVTGGAGFLGSHLCEFLLNKGEHVICVDNFFTGSRQNVKHLIDHPEFELIRHDIVMPLQIECDQIYNLACPASPIHYQYNSIKTLKTCILGMHNMLGLAKRLNARILQASTSEVYGNPEEHPQKESYWGRVNPIGVRSCFSEDTEVLTFNGWKLFKDVSKKDKIMTLDKNGKCVYQSPIEIIKEKYIGDMISFKNTKVDLLVTPNHKMYVKPRGKSFSLIPAYFSLNWKRANMKKSGKWEGKEKKWFYLPKVKNAKFKYVEKILMDDWLEFMGYYLTEGCVHLRKRSRVVNNKEYLTIDYNVLVAQDKKSPFWNKIKKCLERLPFKFYSSDDHQFRICNKQLADYLLQFGKSKDRFVPNELKNLSKKQIKILFDALMIGDGAKSKETFYTSSWMLRDDFQEILLKIGCASGCSIKDKRKSLPVYQIHILTDKKRDFLHPLYPERKIEKYDGYVYCVNVPNHVIYVRRNLKTLFCGNCYDEGKRAAETMMMDYHRQHKVDIRIIRIFNTYGPKMALQDGRVVSNFIIQALANKDITVFGDGSQTRSFCYVSDLIEGMYRMMNQEEFIGPVNLGNPGEFTILELANKVIQLTGSSSKLMFRELPMDDPVKRRPDISLAQEKLNWSPTIPLCEGLKRTIEYYRERCKVNSSF